MQDYKLAVGYLKKASNPDGLEKEEEFYSRMAGMIALYAAITQTDPLPGKKETPLLCMRVREANQLF